MFVDEKRHGEAEQTTDPFTLASLIAWLEKQPAERTYCYIDGGQCLLAQYFCAVGMPVDGTGGSYVRFASNPYTRVLLPNSFQTTASGWPSTFGAALERARAIAE